MSNFELNSSAFIPNKTDSDLSCDVAIRHHEELNATAILNIVNDLPISYVIDAVATVNDLISEMGIYKAVDVLSDVILKVKANNDQTSDAQLYNIKDILCDSLIPYMDDMPSDAVINEFNFMNVAYVVNFLQKHIDIVSTAGISHFSDLLVDAYIKAQSESDLDSSAEIYYTSDISGQLVIPHTEELESSMVINEFSFLNVVYDLIIAPFTSVVINDIQDTYVREARPTLNYGDSISLIVGGALEGRYRSLLEFDLQSYFDLRENTAAAIVKTELVIDSFAQTSNTIKVGVYEYTPVWNENTATWANTSFSQNNKVAEFYPDKNNEIRIDIEDYLAYKYSSGNTRGSIYFRLEDETDELLFSFYSKDTAVGKPYIDLIYQQSNFVAYSGEIDLDADSTIRGTNNKDIFNDIVIRRSEDSDMSSEGIVRQSGLAELNQDMTARLSDIEDLNTSSTVRPKTDLAQDAIIRVTTEEDLSSDATVIFIEDLSSDVDIRATNSWLDGHITVKATAPNDLDSVVNIRTVGDLVSDATFAFAKELQATADLNLVNTMQVECIVGAQTEEDLDSSVLLRGTHSNDLDSDALLKVLSFKELENDADIFKFIDMDSGLAIQHGNDLDASATINLINTMLVDYIINAIETDESLNSTVVLRRTEVEELSSDTTIIPNISLDSEATIVVTQKDIESDVVVRITAEEDLITSTILYQVKDLVSEITIRQSANSDMDTATIIRQVTDLAGNIDVYLPEDITVDGIIRQTKFSNLDSDIVIRQFDVNELDSTLYVYGLYSASLPSTVFVNVGDKTELFSDVTINSDARTWIPNIHAPQIFAYADRKLPRVWPVI